MEVDSVFTPMMLGAQTHYYTLFLYIYSLNNSAMFVHNEGVGSTRFNTKPCVV